MPGLMTDWQVPRTMRRRPRYNYLPSFPLCNRDDYREESTYEGRLCMFARSARLLRRVIMEGHVCAKNVYSN